MGNLFINNQADIGGIVEILLYPSFYNLKTF